MKLHIHTFTYLHCNEERGNDGKGDIDSNQYEEAKGNLSLINGGFVHCGGRHVSGGGGRKEWRIIKWRGSH